VMVCKTERLKLAHSITETSRISKRFHKPNDKRPVTADRRPLHPIPNSSEDSSGVPQRLQITDEQSPHVNGSLTSTSQTAQ
jgi:hypothetical protein